jgi:hypothetical protein
MGTPLVQLSQPNGVRVRGAAPHKNLSPSPSAVLSAPEQICQKKLMYGTQDTIHKAQTQDTRLMCCTQDTRHAPDVLYTRHARCEGRQKNVSESGVVSGGGQKIVRTCVFGQGSSKAPPPKKTEKNGGGGGFGGDFCLWRFRAFLDEENSKHPKRNSQKKNPQSSKKCRTCLSNPLFVSASRHRHWAMIAAAKPRGGRRQEKGAVPQCPPRKAPTEI